MTPTRLALRLVSALLIAGAPLLRADVRAEFGPMEHDFGEVRRGAKVTFSVSVHNAGDAVLEFKGVRFSEPGMTARMPGRIPAGGDGVISLEWATEHLYGKVKGTAVVMTNDPAHANVTLELEGVVRPELEIEPMPAVFLSVFRDEEKARTLTLKSNQSHPVDLRLKRSDGRYFLANLSPTQKGRSWRLTVRAAPGLKPGRYDDEVRILCDDPSIGEVGLPVHVLVKGDVYANPDEIDFGDVPLARIRQQPELLGLLGRVILVTKREGRVGIGGVTSSVAAVRTHVTPASGPEGAAQIDVALDPEKLRPGSLEGTITVKTDDPRVPRLTLPIRGRVVE